LHYKQYNQVLNTFDEQPLRRFGLSSYPVQVTRCKLAANAQLEYT